MDDNISGQGRTAQAPLADPPQSQPSPSPPPPYIVEPTATHTHSIIFLHGLGDSGRNFGTELLETGFTYTGHLLPQLLPGARFIFPTAARRRSSAFNRSVLNMWFDIARLPDPEYRRETQLRGLAESAAQLDPLVREEARKVGARNVILGGISNGSAMSMALLLAIGAEMSLGGYIGLCSYLPYQRDIMEAVTGKGIGQEDEILGEENPFGGDDDGDEAEKSPTAKAMEFVRDLLDMESLPSEVTEQQTPQGLPPVFLGHGALDEKKPPALGEAAADTLRACGFQVTWKLYPELGHWYQVPEEIDDIVKFVESRVGWKIVRYSLMDGS